MVDGLAGSAARRRQLVEAVIEDGFDRAERPGLDVECAAAGGFDALATKALHQAHMPRQARKPCSGCERSTRIFSHSNAVQTPMAVASRPIRSMVQSAKRRWDDGMCSGVVVCLPLPDPRMCAAMRSPWWNS